mgnify:CR=1 FL=1
MPVPIRRVYFVINEVTLTRWPDGTPVPVLGLSLSLDADSWAWGFDATLPLIAEAKPFALVVQPAIRLAIRKLVRSCMPDTPVMSFFEVPEDKSVEVVAVIGAPGALPA